MTTEVNQAYHLMDRTSFFLVGEIICRNDAPSSRAATVDSPPDESALTAQPPWVCFLTFLTAPNPEQAL